MMYYYVIVMVCYAKSRFLSNPVFKYKKGFILVHFKTVTTQLDIHMQGEFSHTPARSNVKLLSQVNVY